MSAKPKIVAFTGGGIGDALFHVGHFQGLAARGGGSLTLACKKGEALGGLFDGMEMVAGVIGLADDERISGQITPWKAAAKLRPFGFDEMWCFHPSTTLALSAVLAGIGRRFGFYLPGSLTRVLYTHGVETPRETAYPPMASRADALLRAHGVPFDTASARLRPGEARARAAEAMLGGRLTVALGVNGSVPGKQWGGERYGRLSRMLSDAGAEAFLLFGAGDVADEASAAISSSGLGADRFIDLTGMNAPLALGHALLARCAFYVGNDSSGLNLAAFSGLPAIGLFGPTPPLTYSPLIEAVRPPGGSGAMDAISVENVSAACLRHLKRGGA